MSKKSRRKLYVVYIESEVTITSDPDGPRGEISRERAIESARAEFIEKLRLDTIDFGVEEQEFE